MYRPELVEETPRVPSDPEGKYKDEAFMLNLEKIKEGPAPQIDLLERKPSSCSAYRRAAWQANSVLNGTNTRSQ